MNNLEIYGDKVLLVWNRGNKNLWDELILIGLMKILLKQNKKIFVDCTNKSRLKGFHKQFLDIWNINYIQELPKGIRSSFRFLKKIKDIKYYFKIDSIVVWGWEILTEETPFSYWYWFLSIWPSMFFKRVYFMWWIQTPKKLRNKIIFSVLMKNAKKLYVRDYDLIDKWEFKNKIKFFPDTSFFVFDNYNLNDYSWKFEINKTKEKKIIININKKAERFWNDILEIISKYKKKWYDVYFARICKSPKDNDLNYYNKLLEKFDYIKLLDYEKDFRFFLKELKNSEKVFWSRLHLFLICYYLWIDIKPFVYEKKVSKMQSALIRK